MIYVLPVSMYLYRQRLLPASTGPRRPRSGDRFRLLVPLITAVGTLRVWMERHVQMIALADESPSSLVGRARRGVSPSAGLPRCEVVVVVAQAG